LKLKILLLLKYHTDKLNIVATQETTSNSRKLSNLNKKITTVYINFADIFKTSNKGFFIDSTSTSST